MVVRMKVLNEVGSFDPRFFMYGEDYDLCQRVIKAGWIVQYVSESVIVHLGGKASEIAGAQFESLMICNSNAKLMLKYYGLPGMYLYRLAILLGSLFRLVLLGCLQLATLACSKTSYRDAMKRYRQMMIWSLGSRGIGN
jgi:GT2 family glycosyltransferase